MSALTEILIVDGSPVSQEIIARILSEALQKSNVTVCHTGYEALGLLASNKFDLIITSHKLPDLDGLGLAHRIRAISQHHYTPIVLITGKDDDNRLARKGFTAGVTDYFDKSNGYNLFGDFIKAFCQRYTGLVGRVLYIEDSATAAALTKPILERHGLHITHTVSAEEALELLDKAKADKKEFDLIIADFFLEGEMTGGDLLFTLRTRRHYSQQDLPVLVVTGSEDTLTQLEAFHAGANDFVNKPLVEEVLMARVRSLLLIRHQFVVLKRQALVMQQMATTDSLTGVRNRRYLANNGARFLADQHNHQVWALIMDLDHFKLINDKYGHTAGDHVLAAIGSLLKENFPDSLAVRLGGEEFAILLPRGDQGRAITRAEMLRQKVELLAPEGIPISTSIGMVCAQEQPGAALDILLELADKALYAAKEKGRNQVCVMNAMGKIVSLYRADRHTKEASDTDDRQGTYSDFSTPNLRVLK
ncbi:MAG: diguanylate cyclase [Gammaproteobacteria bacterium]|nr:diguanylate cyclase [Gammaproteobacteria bacterium]